MMKAAGMLRPAIAIATTSLSLTACVNATDAGTGGATDPVRPANGDCNAQAAQAFVGQAATQKTGAAIREASGARILRWGPPDSAWTMDYRQDRVNVRYDHEMMITTISCG